MTRDSIDQIKQRSILVFVCSSKTKFLIFLGRRLSKLTFLYTSSQNYQYLGRGNIHRFHGSRKSLRVFEKFSLFENFVYLPLAGDKRLSCQLCSYCFLTEIALVECVLWNTLVLLSGGAQPRRRYKRIKVAKEIKVRGDKWKMFRKYWPNKTSYWYLFFIQN